MKYLKKPLLLLPLFLVPTTILFAQSSVWIDGVTNGLLTIVLPPLATVLIGSALLYFVWGLVMFIAQSGNEQVRTEGKQRMIWGIVALFVLVSVWGFVILLRTIFGVSGVVPTPPAPQTTYTPAP